MEKRQLSLFEEISKEKRKITLSIDKLYLFFILLTIALIGSFCLGVERGKHLSLKLENTKAQENIKLQKKVLTKEDLAPQKIIKQPTEREEKERLEKDRKEGFYSIQLASYKRKEIAEIEAKKLKKKGLEPILLKKGKYLILCVGKFGSKEEARKLLTNLRRYYSDCFIRKFNVEQRKERYL